MTRENIFWTSFIILIIILFVWGEIAVTKNNSVQELLKQQQENQVRKEDLSITTEQLQQESITFTTQLDTEQEIAVEQGQAQLAAAQKKRLAEEFAILQLRAQEISNKQTTSKKRTHAS